jgi:D-amino peptidase
MKFYLSVDMEGISGLTQGSYMNPGNSEYYRYRKIATLEVNHIVESLVEMGAEKIIVNDGHSSMKNLLIEELHSECELITGYPRPNLQLTGLDESFDGLLLIGYHARSNSTGIFAHTFTKSAINDLYLNEQLCSEADFNAMIANYYNVPVIFISGDDILYDQVKSWFPSKYYLITKTAYGNRAALCKPPKKNKILLKEKIQQTITDLNENSTFPQRVLKAPYTLKIRTNSTDQTLVGAMIPGFSKIDDFNIEFTTSDIVELQNALNTYINATGILMLSVFA